MGHHVVGAIGYVDHTIFNRVAVDVERSEHRLFFAREFIAMVDISVQDLTELAAFIHV